jgi:hypothetical protein
MKKADWEKQHNYRISELHCSHCRHLKRANRNEGKLMFESMKYECVKKMQDKAGKETKTTCICDLWEKAGE